MASSPPTPQPASPELIFATLNAHERSAALGAAIELDLFSAIGAGASSAADIAQAIGAKERGARILCDFLVIAGLLAKNGSRYALTPDSAAFLDRRSPQYLGDAARFLQAPDRLQHFGDLVAAVRDGGSSHVPSVPDWDGWVTFARAMGGFMTPQAELLAERFGPVHGHILDVAASHGRFGLAFARRSASAEVTALDAAAVLEVARENAAAAGLGGRYHLLPGDVMKVPLGEGYELILLANILHHYAPAVIVSMLGRVRAALAPAGRVLTLEFVPNPDRVSPPAAASFSLTMLSSTREGDAYTFAEYQDMFRQAGFRQLEAHALPTAETALIAER
ncbi:MAG: methyltransferase [Terriglobales bacterium]